MGTRTRTHNVRKNETVSHTVRTGGREYDTSEHGAALTIAGRRFAFNCL